MKNVEEAELVLALCRYLLQQGYSSKEITVLAPYQGQVATFKQVIS
jgi:hypothetical protein